VSASNSSAAAVDRESALLYCCFISFLLGSPARDVIGNELERTLCELLTIAPPQGRPRSAVAVDVTHLRLLTAASLPAMDGSGDIDDDGDGSSGWGVLQALCRLTTEGGRTLPGLVLLEIVDGFLATQPEDRAEKFLMAWGGLAALLGVVAGRRSDDTVRARGAWRGMSAPARASSAATRRSSATCRRCRCPPWRRQRYRPPHRRRRRRRGRLRI
jgi:hypothetical protein